MEKTGPINQSSIQLKLTTKGKYHWAITIEFDGHKALSIEEAMLHIQSIDKTLRDKFPNNTTMTASSSRFSSVDEFSDDED